MAAPSPRDITRLLEASSDGRTDVMSDLLPVVYAELRRLASSYMRRERADHTLQPTALAHEACLRLVDQRVDRWQNRCLYLTRDPSRQRRAGRRDARAPSWSGAT